MRKQDAVSPKPTDSQRLIISADDAAQMVVACAGSGKTLTAVHRLASIPGCSQSPRGRIALLSFSNVAVDTFRRDFRLLGVTAQGTSSPEISTLDSFFNAHVLNPHGHRTMLCSKRPFLVSGSEPFLQGFSVPVGTSFRSIAVLKCEIQEGKPSFYCDVFDRKVSVDRARAMQVVARLGAAGAYTYELARYWAYRTLVNQAAIRRALAKRYRQILIDEAQDLGSMHQAIIELLIAEGVKVSLIGDPNQAIYAFAGADGAYLSAHAIRPLTRSFQLTENFRSVPSIVDVANSLTGRNDQPMREEKSGSEGPFVLNYASGTERAVLDAFVAAIGQAGLNLKNSAVLCRANTLADKIRGGKDDVGQGLIKLLANAAIARDSMGDPSRAFELIARVIYSLLSQPPSDFRTAILSSKSEAPFRQIRRHLWKFASDPEHGLPHVTLKARSEWHPQVLSRMTKLLQTFEADFGLAIEDNIPRKLAKRGLPTTELSPSGSNAGIRVDTVHRSKGESLDAVLYFATAEHAKAMLDGPTTELGRIGYVAVTRARDLLWVAIPESCAARLTPRFSGHKFKPLVLS